MPPEQDLPLESLEKRLYQPEPHASAEVPSYSPQQPHAPYGWTPPPPPPPKKRIPWTVAFLIGAGAFLVLAGLVAAFLIFFNSRAISNNNVQITVPPTSGVASGDTVSLVITIHNGNPVALTDASFNADLPDGTRTADGTDSPLSQYNDVLGPIPAHADVTRTIQAKLFGEAGQTLTIPMKVQYHVTGSNALYQAETDYTVTITSSPVSVQVQSVSQTPSGQSFTMTVLVRSNSTAPLEDVALTASYPSGFSVASANPSPTGTNFFDLGPLAAGDEKTILIHGTLTGQDGDQRVFRFDAGSKNPDGTSTLGNTYAEGSATVTITHPFLNVSFALNSSSDEPLIVQPGDQVSALLSWQNTLSQMLSSVSMKVAVSGSALAPGSVNGGSGFFNSSDSSVVFDSTTNQSLASLSAGQSGVGSFAFGIRPASQLAGIQNPTVTLVVSISGIQSTQGSSAQTLTSTLTRTVKVGTVVSVSSALSPVSGPVPPTSGTQSTYNVTLTAKNTVNSIGAAKETFTLPSYVSFVSAADGSVAFDPDTSTVTWTIGDLAGGGTATTHFQIRFTPSTSQAGGSPVLVNTQTFSGYDRFTQQQVSATAPSLTSDLSGKRGSGTVQ